MALAGLTYFGVRSVVLVTEYSRNRWYRDLEWSRGQSDPRVVRPDRPDPGKDPFRFPKACYKYGRLRVRCIALIGAIPVTVVIVRVIDPAILAAALLMPIASLAIGLMAGTALRVVLLFVIPLAVIMIAGFLWLPGVLGDIAIGIGVVAFLLMVLPTGFGRWWYRTVVPKSWRE
jgi:hypothetical protein